MLSTRARRPRAIALGLASLLGLLAGQRLEGRAAAQSAAPSPAPAPTTPSTPSNTTASTAPATNALASAGDARAFEIPFEKYTLDNGLEVILHRDPTLPNVAVNLWYHVGPANEPKGRSGFAHLFEHLMFEGSKYAGKDFDVLLESAGGTNMNGTTSFDRTNYFETVPSEQLALALWLESDRMGFMIDTLTEERLEVQRGVVLNERRQSYENRPYGPSELAMYDKFFPDGHPYHGNVIGSIADLERATMEDVRAFFAAYYAPSNATLALAGDIEPEATKKLVERYFGSLPKRPRPTRPTFTTPPLAATERLAIEEPVSLAKVTMAWITPPAFSADEAAIELATHVLGSGKASRLYRDLVVTGLAANVDSWLDDNELASIVGVDAMVSSGVPIEKVEQALEKSLVKLASEGPTAAELERAKKGIFVDLASSLQLLNSGGGEGGRAGVLQQLNHYLGDPGRLPAEMQHLGSVTPAEVQAAVQKYLPTEHRLTVVTVPKAADAAPGGQP
ncbi:MAG TPA: pitrilysin family protein [Polyangiaceae bacterium]|nr:pitrilysin family protein [Polyangiaceae bacterium]